MAMRRISLTEALPTAGSELTANWPTASLSNRRIQSSLSPERKSLQEKKYFMVARFGAPETRWMIKFGQALGNS